MCVDVLLPFHLFSLLGKRVSTHTTVKTFAHTAAVVELAARLKVEVPILDAIHEMLSDRLPPSDFVPFVMTLPLGDEEEVVVASKL